MGFLLAKAFARGRCHLFADQDDESRIRGGHNFFRVRVKDVKLAAFSKAQEWGERIPIGVIYRKERPTFEKQLPALNKGPLVKQKLYPP